MTIIHAANSKYSKTEEFYSFESLVRSFMNYGNVQKGHFQDYTGIEQKIENQNKLIANLLEVLSKTTLNNIQLGKVLECHVEKIVEE